MNVCACVIVIIINNTLQRHGGDMAIGAYGIINRLLTLYIMIVLGLTMGMQPIVGYNFGAQKHDRVKQTLKLSILTGVCITSSGFLICELFPHAVSVIFTNDQELIDIASRGVRICVLMFPLVGAQIVIGNFFQSIGKAKISIFLSLTRQLLYLLPSLIFFPRFMGLDGIWTSMPVADFFCFPNSTHSTVYVYTKGYPNTGNSYSLLILFTGFSLAMCHALIMTHMIINISRVTATPIYPITGKEIASLN